MLKGKTVLVTGANRGIGRSIAEKFAISGAKVYANAREQGSLEEFAKTTYEYGSVIPLYFDVCDSTSVRDAYVTIKKENKSLDCLVNNAGILVDTLLSMLNRATLRSIYETNVFAVFEMMQYASRIMSVQKSGSIINVASICGDEGGMRGQTAYSSSKGAVIALTKTAAKELGPLNIRVNAVSPGFIDTDMFRSGPPEIQKQLIDGVYLSKRVGLAIEVANVCEFLASDNSSYVNEENIRVDGFSHI